MAEAVWLEPRTLEETLAERASHGDGATLVAGGTFLGILVRSRVLAPERLVSLRRVEELQGIEVRDGRLHLGAMASHREIERSPLVRAGWPMLAAAFGSVASVRIRNQATVGGVLRDADYASDPPAALAAHDAWVVLASQAGRRELPVASFIVGQYETELREDEVIEGVVVPPALPRATYLKFRTRSSEDRPCAGVAVALDVDDDARVRELRVAVGAVSPRLDLHRDVCEAARGQPYDEPLWREVGAAYRERAEPVSDLRGSSSYRRRMVEVLVRRAMASVRP